MLRRIVLPATVAVCFAAPNTWAQCAFDTPARAQGMKVDLVRTYAACPGATFAAPNTATMAGVPGCAPPARRSSFTFGPKGACRLTTRHKIEEPCTDGSGYPCSNIRVKARCKDIRDGATDEPVTGGTWALYFVVRGTVASNCGGGTPYDVTVVDSPIQYVFKPPKKGSMKLDLNLDGPFRCPPIGFFPPYAWNGCSSVEMLAVSVVDPDGNAFAKMGSSTR